jgi:hypothetical protein
MAILKWVLKIINLVRFAIVNKLWKIKARLNVVSLRMAIDQADKSQAMTGRKMIVIFNSSSMEYEAVEKQTLKAVANIKKVNGQPAHTKYRKRNAENIVAGSRAKIGSITHHRVHRIEKRSLYVTK